MPALDICYIGGSPCAGKSSVADILAERHALHAFHCDDGVPARLARTRRHASDELRQVTELTDCERLSRPPTWQAEKEILFYLEQFPFLRPELEAAAQPCVAEGNDLMPELLQAYGVPVDRAVWLVPTPQFQLAHYHRRDWAHQYVAGCPDPGVAFANWMRRDMLFAEHVAAQARRLGGRVIVVDGSTSVDQLADEMAGHFALSR